ncbi:MAG: hypothetical protein WA822_03755 [Albidovulum sp.]
MMSAQGALPAHLVLFALFCIPPLLSLRVTFRRAASVRRRGHKGIWPAIAAVFSVAAFLTNLVILTVGGGNDPELRTHQGIAMALAWLCFWLWLFFVFAFRRRKRRLVY